MTKEYQLTDSEQTASEIKSVLLSGVFGLYPYLPDAAVAYTTRKLLDLSKIPYGKEYLEKTMVTLKHAFNGYSPVVKKKIKENFFINECVKGAAQRAKLKSKLGINIPETMVISPTMKCPLRCRGCYAAQYAKDADLEYAVFDGLITEAKSMGIYFFVISGGEPFVYPRIWDLLEKHNDCWFQIYTSGVTMNQENALRLAGLGNVNLCISVEGFEKETDFRRGPGHFQKVLKAFANLREAGLPFGFSATATRENNDLIMSENFVEFYKKQGAFFGWYFQYMPIGRSPNFDLVPTPKQRISRFYKMFELRKNQDIFLVDFWNDGCLSGGCIAGGRSYLHINHQGDIEPCVFCQISKENIHTTGLLDALTKSTLFKAIRKRQPYNENLLLPCIMIDNPNVLREVLDEANPQETCGGGAKRLVTDLYDEVLRYAREYAVYANDAWSKLYENGNIPSDREAQEIGRKALKDLDDKIPFHNELLIGKEPRERKEDILFQPIEKAA